MGLKILSMYFDGNRQHTTNKKHRNTRKIKDLKFSMAELHRKKGRYLMSETEKKLEDYQKNCVIISDKDFEKMSYQERIQLYNEHPEEYERHMPARAPQPKKSGNVIWTSQIRYDD